MEKINHKIILFFLFLQPLLDSLIVLIPSVPISTMIRGLFFIYVLVYLLREKQFRKLTIVMIVTMLIYFLYHHFYLHSSILDSCTSIFKFYYLSIIILFFSQPKVENIDKYLMIILLEYVAIYLLSYLFHIGYNNYLPTDGKTGYRGLFNSINEYSAILVVLYYMVFDLLKQKKIMLILVSILLFIISYLTGTKVLLGGLIFIILLKLLPMAIKTWKKQRMVVKILSILLCISLLVVLGYGFTLTNTYKNMLVQAEFFKVNTIFSMKGINKVLFNDRLTFLMKNHHYFLTQNIIIKLLGFGHFNPFKLVEIDLFDILYRYGIIGFIIEMITFVFYFHKGKEKKIDFIPFFLLMVISLTSGHVLLSPNVSIYIAISLLRRNEKMLK